MKATITSSSIVLSRTRKETSQHFRNNLSQYRTGRKTNGIISAKTQSTVKTILTHWEQVEDNKNGKFLFLTLTVPKEYQHLSDTEIKRKHLNKYLEKLRYNRIEYLWVAESAEDVGIHFHLVIHSSFELSTFRSWWFGNSGACAVRSVNDMKGLADYITKSTNNREIDGRLWGCSRALKVLKPMQLTEEDSQQFHYDHTTELTLCFVAQYYAVCRPSRKLKRKIIKQYKAAYLSVRQASAIQESDKFKPNTDISRKGEDERTTSKTET
jgi:hypothetical protein